MPSKRPKQPPEFKTTYIDMDAERIVTRCAELIETYGPPHRPKDGAYYRWFALKFNHRMVAAGTWEFSEAQVEELYLVLTSAPKED